MHDLVHLCTVPVAGPAAACLFVLSLCASIHCRHKTKTNMRAAIPRR
jgi:hypothetical protein